MSAIIRISDLCKEYRLYKKPHHRFLDAFGLLRDSNAYTVHHALRNISFEIQRGEKVAFIGRNGAGKSTLLRIISGVSAATSGEAEVNGTVHALLGIGQGFHPDFTGRENVYSFLSQVGISGRAADVMVQDIINFAEIGPFIDQPIKTYSSGMSVRLMFSASTCIRPDVLVVDEVLGAGDAYFSQKSFERMKALCTADGTTLLLVTHDIYSAVNLCDRIIWIDKGSVVMDGDSRAVVNAYEGSIRLQHEEYLREQARASWQDRGGMLHGFFQIVPDNREKMQERLPMLGIRLLDGDTVLEAIDMASGLGVHDSAGASLVLAQDSGNWGPAYSNDGRPCRDFQPYGSIFHRAPFFFAIPAQSGNLSVQIDYQDSCSQKYYVEAYVQGRSTVCLPLGCTGSGEGRSVRIQLSEEGGKVVDSSFGLASHADISKSGERLGSSRIRINSVRIEDENGAERLIFNPLEPLSVRTSVEVMDPEYSGRPTVICAFIKNDVDVATRLVSTEHAFGGGGNGRCDIVFDLRPHLLRGGEYSINVAVYEEDYFNRIGQQDHSASSSLVMDKVRRAALFQVLEHGIEMSDCRFSQPFSVRFEEQSEEAEEAYSLQSARDYWRHAPSGKGKVDTAVLLELPDGEFLASWGAHFKSRLRHYWEDKHFVDHFARLFAGKRVLSFGSGIGINEVQFLAAGASLVCADIVPSNLKVIERACKLLGLSQPGILVIDKPGETDFGGPYDYIYARGSLMTVPLQAQVQTFAHFKRALAVGGEVILNLYTWAFVQQTCGKDDPRAFALCSDPSVGDCHNPWSDWHDDAKMLAVVGEGMRLSHQQLWNNDLYVWYMVGRDDSSGLPCTPILPDIADLELRGSQLLLRFGAADFTAELAALSELADGCMRLQAETPGNQYMAKSKVFSLPEDMPSDGAEIIVRVDYSLQGGGFSIELLDVPSGAIIAGTGGIMKQTPGSSFVRLCRPQKGHRLQLLVSNYDTPGGPGTDLSLDRVEIWAGRGSWQDCSAPVLAALEAKLA